MSTFCLLLLFSCHFIVITFSLQDYICPTPFITNGNFSIYKNSSSETLAVFKCNTHYFLIGGNINVCNYGKWVRSFPTCRRKKEFLECKTPNVEKGLVQCLNIECNKFYVGTEAAIQCETGFRLDGSDRIICQLLSYSNPVWNYPIPKCVPVDPVPNLEIKPINITYDENNTIVIIIIILSVLAGSLVIIMSFMWIRQLIIGRICQYSSNDYHHQFSSDNINPIGFNETVQAQFTSRWNCFRTMNPNSRYQNMNTQVVDNVSPIGHDNEAVENADNFSNSLSDDRASLIHPPCYDEAIKSLQYSIVTSPEHSVDKLTGVGRGALSTKHKSKSRVKRNRMGKSSTRTSNQKHYNTGINNNCLPHISKTLQANDLLRRSHHDSRKNLPGDSANNQQNVDNSNSQQSSSSRNVIPDNPTFNISDPSSNSFRYGSVETMAISDGTSVTVHTYDSVNGSNPSLGSMRPQTGSVGDPINSISSCNVVLLPSRCPSSTNDRFAGYPVMTTVTNQPQSSSVRYSPPPSYESSFVINNNSMNVKSETQSFSNTRSSVSSDILEENVSCAEDFRM